MRKLLIGSALAVLWSCQSAQEAPVIQSGENTAEEFSFLVLGDTPYSDKDRTMLDEALPIIKDKDYPFIIHVGDYKGGGSPCETKYDTEHQDLIASLSPAPVFYTPGDNEWVDCDRKSVGEPPEIPSEKARLETIRSLFFSGQQPTDHDAVSQSGHPENQRWQYQGVQFATLHVVATNNGRSQVLNPADLEWAKTAVSAREAANLKWLGETFEAAKQSGAAAVVLAMQADMTDLHVSKKKPETSQVHNMSCGDAASKTYLICDAFTETRAAIRDAALDFGRPVILIHGDSSPFTFNQEFAGEEAPNLWRLNAAGDAGERGPHKWGTRDVTVVTVHLKEDEPISAAGLMTQKVPKAK